MTRYILAFGMLGLACLAYLILAFGARFNRTDESLYEGSVREEGEGQGSNNHGERI